MGKKVLIFPYSHQLGSTIPAITLANILRNAGHDVTFASQGTYTHVIKDKGFTVEHIPEVSYKYYREHVDNNSFAFYSKELVRHLVDSEMELIERLQPDLVVAYNRPSAYVSAKITNSKLVGLALSPLTKYYDYRYFVPENHVVYKAFNFVDVNDYLPPFATKMIFDMNMRNFAKGFNEVLKKFNRPVVDNYLDLNEGDITFLVDIPGLTPMKDLPSTFHYLPQNTESGFGQDHDWMDDLETFRKEGKKVIFVSMGSSSAEAYPVVIDNVIKFVETHPDKYILVSNHIGLKQHTIDHSNIFIEQFINPQKIYDKVDLVVTHGGKNTLNEILTHGKPVVGVPEQAEQLWNLRFAESIGLGKVVSRFKLNRDPNILLDAILEVLGDPSYADRAVSFAEKIRNKNSENTDAMILDPVHSLLNA